MGKPGVEVVFRGKVVEAAFLDEGEITVGRHADNRIVVDDAGVSRRHARVFQDGDEFFVEDLGSSNGTFIRGEKVLAPRRISHGDEISVADYTLRFRLLDPGTVAAGQDPHLESETVDTLDESAHGSAPRERAAEASRDEFVRLPPGEPAGSGARDVFASPAVEGGSFPRDPARSAEEEMEEFGPGIRIFQGRDFLYEAVVPETGLTIGRSATCDLVLKGEDVSRQHARIVQYDAGRFEIQDTGSRNGIFVNGVRTNKRSLGKGDEIRLGDFRLVFCSLPRGAEMEQGIGTTRLSAGLQEPRTEKRRAAKPAVAPGALTLRDGRVQVTAGGHTYTFTLKVEEAIVTEGANDAEETGSIRLALDDGILEGRFSLLAIEKHPREP